MSETIEYYDNNAASFVGHTINAPMNETRDRFMNMLPAGGRILDFGCGSGRDTKAFIEAGFETEAIDGSIEIAKIASAYTGIEVKHQLFQEFAANDTYDGIWACASLLHLNKDELTDVLNRLEKALKANGILYVSFKVGDYYGIRDERFYQDMTPERFSEIIANGINLDIVSSWISKDTLPGEERVNWLNVILKK